MFRFSTISLSLPAFLVASEEVVAQGLVRVDIETQKIAHDRMQRVAETEVKHVFVTISFPGIFHVCSVCLMCVFYHDFVSLDARLCVVCSYIVL